MKGFLMTLALTCLLSVRAFAGDIPSTDVVAPRSTVLNQATSSSSPGEIPSGGVTLTVIQALIGLLAL